MATSFSPSYNREDLKSAKSFLRAQSQAELVQIIASPTALINRMPGFTVNHLRTAEERVIVDLAQNELNRRNGAKALFLSWVAIGISGISAVLAFLAWRFPIK